MNQSSENPTPLSRHELMKLFTWLLLGLMIFLFITIVEVRYNTQQIEGVLVSSVRSIKFFFQSSKKSQTPHYKSISLVLGINWLLLASIGIVFEVNHQFSIFDPKALIMWQNLLLVFIALMFINESIYDFFRSQMYQNRSEKRWFYRAIGGKIFALSGLPFWFIWNYLNLPKNSPVMIFGVAIVIMGSIVWVFAHLKQPKESLRDFL